jgi:hypothetical protein
MGQEAGSSMTLIDHVAHAYVITDPNGRIQAVSRGGRELLHMPMATKGRSLLRYFPEHRKALAFDITVARSGWATERTLRFGPASLDAITIRYRISRIPRNGHLFWEFQRADADDQRRCA